MIDAAALGLAVERGIISSQQAAQLAALAGEGVVGRVQGPDDEQLRLVSGFGDIFVTLGLALFLGSIAYFVHQAGGALAASAALAAVSWALAEFFTLRRRMALPSIALLATFAGSAFMALSTLFGATTRSYQPGQGWLINSLGLNLGDAGYIALASLVTAALVAIHFARFRVPISVAAGTAALAGAVLAVLFAIMPALVAYLNPLLLICGILVFALAMRFDAVDPRRQTRRADIAFWLHLLAAPLIVHPLVAPFVAGDHALDLQSAGLVLVLFLALGLVAVIVDRRAMLVSGLAYAGVAVGTIVSQSGLEVDRIVPATLLVLGGFVLLLSAGWQPLRKLCLRLLPTALARRLPDPRTVPSVTSTATP
jgi:hypothetical protein